MKKFQISNVAAAPVTHEFDAVQLLEYVRDKRGFNSLKGFNARFTDAVITDLIQHVYFNMIEFRNALNITALADMAFV